MNTDSLMVMEAETYVNICIGYVLGTYDTLSRGTYMDVISGQWYIDNSR